MVVASIYEHGITTQLRCDANIEEKTVTFAVDVFVSHYDPPKLPEWWRIQNVGFHAFPTWPEAVDYYHKVRSEIRNQFQKGEC